MEINFNKGLMSEKDAIQHILQELEDSPVLCDTPTTPGALDELRSHDLMANVTTSLFSSMGIRASLAHNSGSIGSNAILIQYLELLFFVYFYYFIFAALTMVIFALLIFLTRQHESRLFRGISMGYRVLSGSFLLALNALTFDFRASYNFMTSPMILFTYTLVLFIGLVLDRFLDSLAWRRRAKKNARASHSDDPDGHNPENSDTNSDSLRGSLTQLPPIPFDASTPSQPYTSDSPNYPGPPTSSPSLPPMPESGEDLELGANRSTRSHAEQVLPELVIQPPRSRTLHHSGSSFFVDCRSKFDSSGSSLALPDRPSTSDIVPQTPPPLPPRPGHLSAGKPNITVTLNPDSCVRDRTGPASTPSSPSAVSVPCGFIEQGSQNERSLTSFYSGKGS